MEGGREGGRGHEAESERREEGKGSWEGASGKWRCFNIIDNPTQDLH